MGALKILINTNNCSSKMIFIRKTARKDFMEFPSKLYSQIEFVK